MVVRDDDHTDWARGGGQEPKLWSLAEVFSQSGVGDSNEVGGPSSCASLGAIDVKREIIIIISTVIGL